MTTMIDEIFDRQYQAGRHQLHDGIDGLGRRIGGALAKTFEVMHRVQFSAPWAKTHKGRCA